MMTRAQFVLAFGLFLVPGVSHAVEYDGSQLAPDDKRLWTELERSAWIPQGNGRQIIYAIVDPNCPFSRELFRRTQVLIDPQRTQIRWIPVAEPPQPVEDSRQKAAAALEGGLAPFVQIMQGRYPEVPGSSRQLPLINANLTVKADMNAVFQHAGVRIVGVPQFFYVEKNGELRLVNGDPSITELTNVYRGAPSP
jgi:thiol:disulfide interchange protein DsbG